MTRRSFVLAILSLASSASITGVTISRIFLTDKISVETDENHIVMRSGWILLDSDQ